jgi:alginate O-acetyltransferase complex protein AlgI
MLFNSIQFLIFFPIVTLLFFILPHKFRWFHLLVASCVFYMFFIPQYILILFSTILIDYIAAIWIEKTKGRKKKLYLIISIISTCLVLFVFKYFDFFNHNMLILSHKFGFYYPQKVISFILPIGLSFHTFQSLSYVIEVYRGNQKPEKHFGIYSLYVMFYPQLVSGPIERPQNLLVQLRQKKDYDYSTLVRGLRLILFGLFVKMVIADNIGVYVDKIYADPTIYSSLSILTGLFFYSFQIYCDFFGYSTIAIGCALAMGYKLMDNFKNPYLAKNINEFWQRWHISLTSWFRDYVFLPIAYSVSRKLPKFRYFKIKADYLIFMIAIIITYFLSGLWHGANWTFVLWGLSHGFVYIIETIFNKHFKIKKPGYKVLAFIIHFLKIIKNFILVSFIWILFRAKDFHQIKILLKSLITNFKIKDDFIIEPKMWIFLGLFILLDILLYKTRFDLWCNKRNMVLRWSIYSCLIFFIIVFSSVTNYPFIYFQF